VVFSARVGVFRSDVGVRPPGWRENANDNLFVKVGQWPPLLIDPPPELAKALGTEDTELYKKALTNGNSAFGIGALAYFRRVIENKVNMILDLIGNAAQLANFESEELKRLEEIKVSHHVDAKIEYASKILPPHLRPFSATENNGQITQMQDARTGSTVTYSYDLLKRVTGASTTAGSTVRTDTSFTL
jgi:YD repeat-containing protein